MATILIVEDDNFISTFLDAKLKEKYQTKAVADTESAMSVLKSEPIDIILLDIMLPKEDGFTMLERIKKSDSPYRNIPVLILSNFDHPKDIKRGLKLGALEFMVKANFTPAEIVDKVDQALSGKDSTDGQGK